VFICVLDIQIGTELRNITVYKGDPNITVNYALREPYVGLSSNSTIVPLTPQQQVMSGLT